MLGYAAPYCIVDYRADLAIDGISGPIKTRLKLSRRGEPGEHRVQFKYKQETAFFVSVFSSPLFEISTPDAVVYERRLPYVSNVRLSNRGARYKSWSPKMILKEVLKNGRQQLTYRGRFEDIDLSGLVTPEATLRLQYGSTCVTSDLTCRHGGGSSKCRLAP